jgi:hypothetical protein
MKPERIAWAGIFTGPVVWFLSLEYNFALSPLMCGAGGFVAVWLFTLVSLAITAVAATLCWIAWRHLRIQASSGTPMPPGRVPLAFAGAVVSGSAFLLILAGVIPNLIMGGCE